MSGSSGNTNAGGDRARGPHHGNDDVTARHDPTGPQQEKSGSPEESARGRVTGEGKRDSRLADPDQPAKG